MGNYNEYQSYIKPFFAPPPWVFGPVWAFLYLIIAGTYGYVFYLFLNKKIGFWVVFPFILNLIFNILFTYFQFGINNFILAAVDIILILLTILWMFYVIWPVNKNIVYLNIPYLLWVVFATILQFSVTYLNWK